MSFRRRVFRRFGSTSVFEWEEVAERPLEATEVAIDVAFIGVNFADILTRRGYYKWSGKPPICPGFEVSGTVRESGSAAKLRPGTRVMAFSRFGGYTERLVSDEARVIALPDSVSFEDAACIPAVYATAHHALFQVLRARAGESILIQAVAGGVGLAALQLAKHAGLIVYGTASTAEKLKLAQSFGLDFGINYAETDFEREVMRISEGRGVRFVLDSLGGEGLRKGYNCLSAPGHALVIGAAGVVPPEKLDLSAWWSSVSSFLKGGVFHPFPMVEKNRGLSGMQILLLWDQVEYLGALGRELLTLHEARVVKPFVHDVFSLEDVASAHACMESRASRGKILLRP